jgi:histone H3
VALREIRAYQKSFQLLIPGLPFCRLVKEIADSHAKDQVRWKRNALEALQEASEAFLVQHLEMAYYFAMHAKRVTLKENDMKLARDVAATFSGSRLYDSVSS